VNPSTVGDAYVLATAIYAGTDGPLVDTELVGERLYDAVDACGFGSEDHKADLYAQLAERLTATTRFNDAVDIVALAMTRTTQRYGRAH
jgi:hypothetical protein